MKTLRNRVFPVVLAVGLISTTPAWAVNREIVELQTQVQQLADQVTGSLKDAKRLAEAGRERLRTHFSWDVITAKWDAVYRTVSASRPSPSSKRS